MSGQYAHRLRRKASRDPDFSQAAVSKAVLKTTFQRPYVLYPIAVGILGSAAAALLGPSLVFGIAGVLGTAVGLGSWAVDYSMRREHHANAYLRGLHQALKQRRATVIETLERDLQEADTAQGLSQLARLNEKYQAFEEMLRKKLDPKELTYGRYLGMAEQVYLSGLDNLHRIVNTLTSIRAIDDKYLDQRIEELKALNGPSDVQAKELDALMKRRTLKEQQIEKVGHWMVENERAMTRMDETIAAIASMVTIKGHASTDMETAMKELQRLVQRAEDYSLED